MSNHGQHGQHSVLTTISGLPEAYRIGWVPFINVNIYLDSRPLIPRTETEYWVNEVIKEIKESGIKAPKILDLCAGSGCIGVATLKEIPDAYVDFAEINEAHHSTIKKNLEVNNLTGGIFGGNLFGNITDKYDFILSNPPYINPDLSHRVEKSVTDFEPEEALFGGEKGLEIIKKIVSEAPKHLSENGVLCIEHEPEQVAEISTFPGYKETLKDQYGVLRYSRFAPA